MRYTILSLLILLFLAAAQGSLAQNKLSKAADEAYADQMFLLALQKYQKAYSKIKNNKTERDRISLRIAECHRMMNNTKKAEASYKRLIGNAKYVKDNPKILLLYADMLKVNGNYDGAIKQYTSYKENVPNDPKADIGIETCKLAKEWIANPSKYGVKPEKLLNSKEDDFAAAYADKKFISILFTSDRNGAKGKDVDNWTGLGFSDLFLSRIDRKGDWSKPVLADAENMINSKANDGVGQFNPRFSSFYFTRCYNSPKQKNGCGIFKSSRTGATSWSEPEKVEMGGDSSTVMGHPSVSSDETIYFSADLIGGFGGKDIWMARKDKKGGKYMKTNLGPEINTAGDELFPFIRNDSILFERYYRGYDRKRVSTIFSVSKSITSLLVGLAVDDGSISSVRDPITRYIPELKGRDQKFEQLTLENLLNMRTGLKFKESYLNPFGQMARHYYGGNQLGKIKKLKFESEPGIKFEYQSVSTALLGIAVEKSTGMQLAKYLEEKIWIPLGMEYGASWSLDDSKHRVAKAYGGLNTTALDLAKIGRLYLRHGNWEGKQIVSEDWVDKSTIPNEQSNGLICPVRIWRNG